MAQDITGPRSRLAVLSALCLAALGATVSVAARGNTVVPVYEGWYANSDGSFDLVFGYFNRNWDQELDIPAGPAPRISIHADRNSCFAFRYRRTSASG
jgi:hypothetical protein